MKARWLTIWTMLVLASAGSAAASFVTFESGQVRPLALAPDGSRLFAVNTPDGRLEIFDVTAAGLAHRESVPVGLEPVAVAARSDGEVWVVNHLSDSVSIVDVSSSPARVLRTLLVGDEPRDIVFAGPGRQRAFITTAHRGQNSPIDPQLTTPGVGRADVWVFDAAALGPALGGTPLAIVTLFADTPRALAASPDGATVYAAAFHSGNQTTSISEGAVCNGGALAPPCSVGGAFVPGGLPAPNTNFQGVPGPETGLIVRFDRDTGRWRDRLGRDWSGAVRFSLPDLDVFTLDATANPPVATGAFPHVGTVLFDMAVNPVSGTVYVTNGEARNEVRFEGPGSFGGSTVRGHLHEARITVLDGTAVLPRHLNKHIDYGVVPSPAGVKERSLATPLGVAVTADGRTLYVAAFGSGVVGVFDTAALEADTFVPDAADHIALSGGGPSGLVLDDARGRLYVLTRFDDAVSVVDLATRMETAHVRLFNPEPASVVAGRPFLYDARRTSSNGEAACASCHVFGDFDSLGWDLGNPDDVVVPVNPNPILLDDFFGLSFDGFHPLKGPMTTQSLRGLANHGPMHWRGDRTGGRFAGDVVGGLDEGLAFKAFNVAFSGLLGNGGPLSPDDMQAFTDFILQVTYPPNPIRRLDNSLTPDQQLGRAFFTGPSSDIFGSCNTCHTLDPAQGFFGSAGQTTFEGEPQLFKVPHLRNLYQKVGMFGSPAVVFFSGGDHGFKGDQVRGFGFMHDGALDTVFRFLHGLVFNQDTPVFGPNPAGFKPGAAGDLERRQVESFVMAMDSTLAPIVGQQITLGAANAAVAGPRIDLLIARAAAGDCDLVVRGLEGAEWRGWLRAADGTFVTDLAGEPALSDATLRARAAMPGGELTYTCVPPGSGFRIALDHDDDGFGDRTERDEDTDPDDPTSSPAQLGPWVRVAARVLRLTDASGPPARPSRRRVAFKARTDRLDLLAHRIVPPPLGSAGDPRDTGAVLSIYNASGAAADDVRIVLPASGWKASGGSVPAYRFRSGDPDAPLSVVVKRDQITVRGGRAGFGYTLDEAAQGRVAVRLTVGNGVRWCAAAAPARSADDHRDRFKGTGAPPEFCPTRP
jgi:DNA-binding beta-propeller fold protein YncE